MFRWRRQVGAPTYEMRIEVLHGGTRSEGRIGRLYRDGREVRGSHAGETVVDSDGTVYEYLGDERPHLWSTSGWTVRAVEPQ